MKPILLIRIEKPWVESSKTFNNEIKVYFVYINQRPPQQI